MPTDRREGRILAMQTLCHLEAQGSQSDEDLRDFLTAREGSGKASRYATALVRAFNTNAEHCDSLIESASPRWSLDRISPVERNVLRVAVAEMLEGQVPVKVTINEAIEIAREYGGAESPRFVNGVLDEIYSKKLKDLH